MLVLCHPHNPTGRVAPREELTRLASLADAWGVHVIADEIHAPLTFPGVEFVSWCDVSEHGTVVTSASKAFNLPALKLAFVVGAVAEELSEDVRDHAGHLGVLAAEAAFRDGDAWLDETIATIAANHARLPELLPDGVRVAYPAQAGYLAWLDCREAGLGDDPAAAFLEQGRVALFGGPALRRAGLRAPERRDDAGARRGGRQATGDELYDQHDVARGEREVLVVLGLARAVEIGHLDVGQRQERVALRVQEIGQARAEALARQLQRALDLVTCRLDADALMAGMHAPQYGSIRRLRL